MSKPWRNEARLRVLYLGEEMSQREIADELDCGKRTVAKWLNRFDIPQRDQYDPGGPWAEKEVLERLYVDEGLSIRAIADELGAGSTTIERWLEKHGIETRQDPREITGPWQEQETLKQLYEDRRLTSTEIADKFGCDPMTVRRWLRRYDIPIRSRGVDESRRPATFNTKETGYERWAAGNEFVYVHRLLAAMDHSLDELAEKHVHHRNGIPWDNRPENIEVLTPQEHADVHNQET